MEMTINETSFTNYLHVRSKRNRNGGSMIKRLQVKRNKQLLCFNKWFKKEHDYCLPIDKRKTDNDNKNNFNVFDEISMSLESDSSSLDNSKTRTNLGKINVNNELSSCSLYAIDITTELLKDALLENKKKQTTYEQSTAISTKYITSSNNCFYNNPDELHCNENDTTTRLNNGKEKSCVSRESTPPKLFSPMDIDCDMIKLFPALDFSTEHNLIEKPENMNRDIIKPKDIFDKNPEETENSKTHSFCTSLTESPQSTQLQNVIFHEDIKDIKNKKIHSFYKSSTESSQSSQINNLSIFHENTQDTENSKIHSFCTSSTNKSLQSTKVENIISSKCKVDIQPKKLPANTQKSSIIDSCTTTNPELPTTQYINIFNRYQDNSKDLFAEQVENPGPVLLRDLLCGSKPKTIISPYTHRYLKPYIFRDPVTKPLWLRMLKELKEYCRRKKGLPLCAEVETIDYSYVRAKHINSVNALARQFFWPGIDLTESLLYPDFSVVALYKNLVIGFGFMVPDISTNENYITFLFTRPYWTNSGIAKFMIYHLIQTCMTRDITLHVSPNNPAMILYQKFGFKVEEFVQNFYENYIPADSELSKHAMFLRLRSNIHRK